ncbi:MAG: hypothetical protein EXS05_10415 [Planctomycetaceae bacterium]|nr:hypothetical protein [Planctomycetaceae bacterium]
MSLIRRKLRINDAPARWLAIVLVVPPLLAIAGCGTSPAAAPPARAKSGKNPQVGPQTPPPAKSKPAPASGGPSAAQRVRVYRASDPPPRHDDARLAKVGIHKYSSQRMALYTDLDPEIARPLPEFVDRAYEAWTEYFGPLLPDREGSDFFITGYVMVDQALFRETGLLPRELAPFPHGRNQGTRFWMNDHSTDYYRRHLIVHEGTHCFMTTIDHPFRNRPWYMEGMAELFGTHRVDARGRLQFRVLPADREQFPGLGRIRLIHDEVTESGSREISSVIELHSNEYLSNPAYAWSWGLCQFLDGHPRYHERFQKLGRVVTTGIPADDWETLFADDQADINEEWLLFASHVCHGYDQKRAAIDFRDGEPLKGTPSMKIKVAADRGWQSSGVRVEKGKTYQATATGRFIIANARPSIDRQNPPPTDDVAPADDAANRPWESEPQGISFRYHAGRPLGMLVGTIRATKAPTKPPRTTMLEVISLGQGAEFTASETGTLYLRLNDEWNALADNSGEATVEIRESYDRPK